MQVPGLTIFSFGTFAFAFFLGLAFSACLVLCRVPPDSADVAAVAIVTSSMEDEVNAEEESLSSNSSTFMGFFAGRFFFVSDLVAIVVTGISVV